MPSSPRIMVVSAEQVGDLLPVDVAVQTQRRAFRLLSSRTAVTPERLLLPGADDSVAFCYAARLEPSASAVCKFGSVNDGNSARGLPSVSAVMMVLDEKTGFPSCIIDGTSVTTMRTAAASAVAVLELATRGPVTLGVIGSGVQAEAHVRALAATLDLSEVLLFGVDEREAHALCVRLNAELLSPVRQVKSAKEAVVRSSVVVTCTTSPDPVVDASWVTSGTTLVTIGSFAPDRSEVPVELTARADLLVVDHAPTALVQAGNLCAAQASGAIGPDDVVELGTILNAHHPGRTEEDQIIIHTSVGVGIQDAAAAEAIAAAARSHAMTKTIALV